MFASTLRVSDLSWNLRAEALLQDRMHKSTQRPAKLRDFSNELRAQVAVWFSRNHENGFQPRLEFAVHQRHLQLVLVIRDGANPAQDYTCAALPRVVRQEALENVHFYARPMLGHLAQHLHALAHAEKRLLLGILEHRHNDEVEHFFAPLDQVEMAVRHRIKRSR